MAEWVAQVSWNENGFWQGDLFWGEWADTPETFFTLKRGQTKEDAIAKAGEKWPLAELRVVADEIEDGADDVYRGDPD